MPLSKRQKDILAWIVEFIQRNKYPPSVREITSALDISSTSVADYNLRRLAEAGYIRRAKGISRGITLTSNALPATPYIGNMTGASDLDVTFPEHDGPVVETPPDMVRLTGSLVAAQVADDSFTEALMVPGDMVFIDTSAHAQPGFHSVAWDEDSQTLRVHKTAKGAPSDPAHRGVVVGLVRNYTTAEK